MTTISRTDSFPRDPFTDEESKRIEDALRAALAAMTAERDEARADHEREVREVAIECLALWDGAVDIEVFGRSVCSRDTDAGNVVDHVLAERAKRVPTPEAPEARATSTRPSIVPDNDGRELFTEPVVGAKYRHYMLSAYERYRLAMIVDEEPMLDDASNGDGFSVNTNRLLALLGRPPLPATPGEVLS